MDFNTRCTAYLRLNKLEILSRRTSRSLGKGASRVETLVASRFVYKAFCRSTSSCLKRKTLVEGPFDGSRTVYRPPSLFTMLYRPSSCLTSLKLCCAVARQLHGHLQLYIFSPLLKLT